MPSARAFPRSCSASATPNARAASCSAIRCGAARWPTLAVVREWLILPSPQGLMHLAIFLDAHAVAGDAALLAQVRRDLMALALDSDAQVARFASAVDAFAHEPGSW